jgi:hypothetical protein
MIYKEKTKEQLINESAELHQSIEDLKAGKTKHKRSDFVSNVCLVDRYKYLHAGQQ